MRLLRRKKCLWKRFRFTWTTRKWPLNLSEKMMLGFTQFSSIFTGNLMKSIWKSHEIAWNWHEPSKKSLPATVDVISSPIWSHFLRCSATVPFMSSFQWYLRRRSLFESCCKWTITGRTGTSRKRMLISPGEAHSAGISQLMYSRQWPISSRLKPTSSLVLIFFYFS